MNGMWSPKELPTCKAVQCDTPDNPENGKVIYTTKSYNSVVTYECDYGFMIVGSSTRRCGADKKWTGDKPKCKEINCGSPGHLPNGWLENVDKGTSLADSIIFRCLPNMTLEGDDTSVCQSDGTWSKPLPKCLAPCIVPTIEHGVVNNTKPREKVLHGFQLNVTCDDTFELAFGSVPPTCFNGTWSRYPRCKPVYCPFPGTVPYGRVLLVGNMGMYDYRDYVQKKRSANFSASLNSEENLSTDLLITPSLHRHSPTLEEENRSTVDINSVTLDKQDNDDQRHVSVFPRRLWESASGLDSSEEDEEKDEEEAEEGEDEDDEKESENNKKEEIDNLKNLSDFDSREESMNKRDAETKERSVEMINERIRKHRLIKRELSNKKKSFNKRETLSKEERKRLRMERREMRKMNKRRKKGFRGRTFAHCEEINEEVYMKIEILRPGRDDNYTFSSGARLKVTCLHGYGLNIGNKTAKCARGRWKPMKPECFNLSCVLPEILHGRYDSGYKQNLTIMHGASVEYTCDSGWSKSIPEVRCHIGLLQPSPPHCVRNVVNTVTIANNVKRSEPLTEIQETAKPEPLKATESPHGRTYQDSELSTGKDITVMGITTQVEKEIKMCDDIGKYRITGSVLRKCKNGKWTGEEPACEVDKPPTILIRHYRGPIAQSNDGKLVVYPGTTLHLECLWVRRYGTPRWNVSQTITLYCLLN
ncbi:Protein lev-9 [Armadillidium vulgare]|nr:Protein lev-9 [Armadillidium vulgare]